MGLFSSGGKGNSRANTQSTATTTNTTVTQIDNRVTTSDFGAIQGAVDISREVIDFGRSALNASNNNVSDALRTAELATDIGVSAARDVAGEAIDLARDVNRDSLDSVTGIAEQALSDVRSAGEGVLDFARSIFGEALDSNRDTVAANIEGLTQLARDTSQTADDRIVKVVMYSVGAAAAAILGFSLLRGART